MTRPIPRIEEGAADSMGIAMMRVDIFNTSEERTSRVCALMHGIWRQISAARVMFKLTLSEAHDMASWIG